MVLNVWLRRILTWGVFLIPFIPFIVPTGSFFPFITGKNFTFRILVEILFTVWAVLALRDSAYRHRFSLLTYAMGAFLLVVGLADLLSENPLKSFWSNFERMEGYVAMLHLGLYFLILPAALHTEKLWTRFLQTSVGASVLMCFYGVLQLSGAIVINQGGVRVDGTLGNATYLAIYLVFHIFFAALLLVKHRGATWVRYLYGLIILLELYILYHTATRGAVIGLLFGTLVAAAVIALFEKEQRTLRKISIGTIAAVVVIVGGFFAIKNTSFVQNSPVLQRFATISPTQTTVQSRFLVWNMALQGFEERPILGWGQESFNYIFNKFYDPQMYRQEPWFDRAHNIFLDWLVAAGALGLLAYLSFYAIAAWYLIRLRHLPLAERAVLLGLLAAYFTHNVFVFDNLISYIFFFVVLGYLHFRALEARPRLLTPETGAPVRQSLMRAAGVPAVIALMVFSLYFFNVKGIMASRMLIGAIAPQEGGIPQNLENFKKTLALNSFGQQEVREQLLQAGLQVQGIAGLDLSVRREFAELAESELRKQTEDAPNDARAYLFLGTYYNQLGQFAAAEPYVRKALELSPKKQGIQLELGTSLLGQGKYEEGLAVIKQAYDATPEFEDIHIAYVAALIYAGHPAEADTILKERYGTTLVDDSRLLRAYYIAGQFDRVIAIWKERIRNAPESAQNHVGLAAAYLAAGSRTQAIAELQRAIDLDPSFKQQGEQIIAEIRAGRTP